MSSDMLFSGRFYGDIAGSACLATCWPVLRLRLTSCLFCTCGRANSGASILMVVGRVAEMLCAYEADPFECDQDAAFCEAFGVKADRRCFAHQAHGAGFRTFDLGGSLSRMSRALPALNGAGQGRL